MRRTAALAWCLTSLPVVAHAATDRAEKLLQAQGSIQHVIIIMQENRSFDSYFGTYPGADGLAANTCVPLNPANPSKGCVAPYHDVHDISAAASHYASDAQADIDDGIKTTKMNGFVHQQALSAATICGANAPPTDCTAQLQGIGRHDVMGYHTAAEIPNYWSYANHFVLQDQLYAGVRSYSWPAHLELTSEWSASCTSSSDATTCVTNPMARYPLNGVETLPWANLFQLLDLKGVSWKYYVEVGDQPDCEDGAFSCVPKQQSAGIGSIWNPAPFYETVQQAGASYLALHNPTLPQFLTDLKNGTLPQVAWIVPQGIDSEHPPSRVTAGMDYVTTLVNAVMASPYWANTAIFVAWDDWGGFYDHVPPPDVDTNATKQPIEGFGLRVPGLVIGAYAKPGFIQRSVLSFDSYATFIEDLFAGGARLDPAALGNPDSRPSIRDELTSVRFVSGKTSAIGDLLDAFDFSGKPQPPLILTTAIPTLLRADCSADKKTLLCTTTTVSLTWTALPSGTTGTPPYTYHITRDGAELPSCITAATKCTDATAGSGQHLYRIYSVDSAGVVSPASAAVEADFP